MLLHLAIICRNGGRKSVGSLVFRGDTNVAATLMTSSEGEGIGINFGQFLTKLGRIVRDAHRDQKRVVRVYDAFDSGSSIDRIRHF